MYIYFIFLSGIHELECIVFHQCLFLSYLSIILDVLQCSSTNPGEGHCVRAQVSLDRDHLGQVMSLKTDSLYQTVYIF